MELEYIIIKQPNKIIKKYSKFGINVLEHEMILKGWQLKTLTFKVIFIKISKINIILKL